MTELIDIIKSFNNLRVLVIGDVMLDEYTYGDVNRISPEAPIPVLDAKRVDYYPGGAGNAARNVRSLGAKVGLAGVIGPEAKGELLKRILGQGQIDSSGLVTDNKRRTTVKNRVVAQDQQIVRVDFEDRFPISDETAKNLVDYLRSQISSLNAIIISDYAKGVVTHDLAQQIIGLARDNNILCVIDPKGNDYSKYRGCTTVTPNQKELAQALDLKIESESQFLEAGKMLLSHVMCDNLLVTRGGKGMVLFKKNGDISSFPSVAGEKVRDISGAGDTAIGTFALSLAAGSDLKRAMAIASHAAGVVVTKVGTALCSPQELEQSIKNYHAGQ